MAETNIRLFSISKAAKNTRKMKVFQIKYIKDTKHYKNDEKAPYLLNEIIYLFFKNIQNLCLE